MIILYIINILGRFKYLTYNPRKPDKWGIRIIGIADSMSGYCMDLIPCLGKETYDVLGLEDLDDLVISLARRFRQDECCLYIDSYYCHFNIVKPLLLEGIDVTGTFRLGRKDVPDVIKEAVVKKQKKVQPSKPQASNKKQKILPKEIHYFKSTEEVYAVKWLDRKEINILTTHHPLGYELRETSRSPEVKKPTVIP